MFGHIRSLEAKYQLAELHPAVSAADPLQDVRRTRLSSGVQVQTWSNWRMTASTTGTATALPVSLRTVVVGMSIS